MEIKNPQGRGNYIPGVGRGATPFTTRADLGFQATTKPKQNPDPFGLPPAGYVPGKGRGATGFAGGVSRDDSIDDRDRGDYSEANYDEFSGYSEALFKDTEYDEEDRQADVIYDAIDLRMDTRRKSRREEKLKEELAKIRAEKPTIQQQFSNVKRGLSTVTFEEWDSIPSVGDYSIKNKRKKPNALAPAPDFLFTNAKNANMSSGTTSGTNTPIGFGMQTPLYGGGISTPLGLRTPMGYQTPIGMMTPGGGGSATPSLNDLGEARGTVLIVKLDKVMDDVSGQTVIDPKGYLTDLNSMQLRSDADIADIKKARTLLNSITSTNPQRAPGWIAAARLEELSGKIQKARDLIAQGCKHCPKNEDIWLEAARLEKPANAKAVLAMAVKELPSSVKLWLEACNRETSERAKKQVLRKSLEFVPHSVRLWREAVSLENPEGAKILLTRAVECIPESVEMWLALARLSTYTEAQKVLNTAHKKIPTSAEIWVNACKLEETHGNFKLVDIIIVRAIKDLSEEGVHYGRDNWLKLAEEAEASGYIRTCQAIIKSTMKIGVESVNMKRIWKEDTEACLSKGSIETGRAILTNALELLNTSNSLWLALADLEHKHGTPQSLDAVLQKAVSYCPNAEVLWLMAAKQKWLQGDVPAARRILDEAYSQNENKEAISLAAVKLERDNDEFSRAKLLLERARVQCNTPKIWMQSVQLLRQMGDYTAAIKLAEEATRMHPTFDKLWMIAGQLQLEKSPPDCDKASEIHSKGLEICPKSVPLWLCAIDTYRQQKNWTKTRVLLEHARLKNPKDELLWSVAIDVEIENSNEKMANFLVSRALQEFPTSGLLWSKAISLETPARQKTKSREALEKCENDPYVILAASRLFWKANQISHTRKWFDIAVTMNPSLGNSWANYLAFEISQGNEENIKNLISRAAQAEPNQGMEWNKISKRVENWRLSVPKKLKKYIQEHFPDIMKYMTPAIEEMFDIQPQKPQIDSAKENSVPETVKEEPNKHSQSQIKREPTETLET